MSSQPAFKGAAVGAGYFSPYQYEAWNRIGEVRITAICNRTKAKAEELMARFGIAKYYADFRQMIDRERPDFIDIITSPETHMDICDYAARRGVAIICQKPLAPSFEQSQAIVARAQQAGVRFMVHENWRWQPWYRRIKQIQQAGTIGQFAHLYFRMRTGDGWGTDAYLSRQPFFRDYPRLLIYETGVHFVDTFRFLQGEIRSVFAVLRRLNPAIKGEDCGQLFFAFRDGSTGLWDANRYNETDATNPRYTFGQMRIDAMGGHLELDSDSTIRVKPLGQPAQVHQYERRDVNFAGDCCYNLQRHFVECMLSGRPFESNGQDYLRTLRAVEAAYESARRGVPVELEPD